MCMSVHLWGDCIPMANLIGYQLLYTIYNNVIRLVLLPRISHRFLRILCGSLWSGLC